MKKEIIICWVVIILVIILDSVTGNYTKQSVEDLTGNLNVVREKLKNEEDSQIIEEEVSKMRNNWEEKYERLAYYIEHDELEKIELYLVGVDSNVESEEYSQAIEELDKCIFILEHVADKYGFDLKNIF